VSKSKETRGGTGGRIDFLGVMRVKGMTIQTVLEQAAPFDLIQVCAMVVGQKVTGLHVCIRTNEAG
jgi:hypothetical protein